MSLWQRFPKMRKPQRFCRSWRNWLNQPLIQGQDFTLSKNVLTGISSHLCGTYTYGDVHLTTRERYEEDAIEMHLARKRVRVPAEYQEELDLLALQGRRESQQVKGLKTIIMQDRILFHRK